MHRFIVNLEHYIQDHELIPPGSHILAACSGGPDSIALVHALFALQDSLQFHMSVAHVNHLLRDRESERDEAFVKEWATQHNIPCYVSRQDVRALQKDNKLSLEEAARIIRYRSLHGISRRINSDLIALGHHFDDQVETVLMHILRGSGIRGLRGMLSQSGQYIRPLIEVRKKDILDFLHEQHIPFVEDSTNQDLSFLRNKVRHQLLPILEKEYNPRVQEALWRLSKNAAGQLNESKTPVFPRSCHALFRSYPLYRLSGLPLKTLSNELYCFLNHFYQGTTRLARYHLTGLVRMVRSGRGEMNLPEGVKVWIDDHSIYGSRNPVLITRTPSWEYTVSYPGKNRITQLGIFLDFETNPDLAFPLKGDWVVVVDEKAIKPPCSIRNYRPGDRVMQRGKLKKLKEIFSEFGIPVELRRKTFILCDRENILWIPGLILDERIQVGENSKSLLRIRAGKIAG